ncbi:LPS export ABC transporter periplasmic protein LptC [Mesorhizobium sp. CAU 1741]|uniref:LPS export ABC transporter periplasmic protein LptC n=1 Tax=Mesorhizobium sp. CAU 1741 TaxID=3140366 RepID=UPI00325B1FCB
MLKFMLPLAALLIVCGFIARSWLSVPDGVSVNLAGTAIENGRLVMSDPKLDGFTRENRAYTMTAVKAIQDIGDASRIDLEGIKAKLPFNEANWLTVDAATGLYDRDADTLNLGKAISVFTDNGVKANLTSATVDIGSGHITSNEPVDIALDGARLAADSMTIKDNGAVVIFERRVRMEIDPKRMQTAANEGNSTNEN